MKDKLFLLTIGLLLIVVCYFVMCHEPQTEPEVVIETKYAKGKDSIIYKDRWYPVEVEKPVEEVKDSLTGEVTLKTVYDSTFVSGKDSITIEAEVNILNGIAKWLMDIKHKDAETIRVDSLYITKTVKDPPTFFDKVKDVSFIVILVEVVLAGFIFLTGGL